MLEFAERVINRKSPMSDEKQTVERIWVGIPQAAVITGRRKEFLRQLMTSTWDTPVEERPLRVRHRSNRYEFWLPGLIQYLENLGENSAQEVPVAEPIWVNVTEATGVTGYNRAHVSRIVRTMWHQPEDERLIKLRHRTSGYELWLPDLIEYMEKAARGPYFK